jgi:osmoprotectant transport system substrate-binding protein
MVKRKRNGRQCTGNVLGLLFVLILSVGLLAPVAAGGSGEQPDGAPAGSAAGSMGDGDATGDEGASKGPVTVASKIDTEGSLLGNMIVLVLENDGFDVENQVEFGPTDVIRRAITSGEIDLYPEYTGNGAFFFDEADSEVWKDGDAGYQRVKELDAEENGLVWLTPADANNTWAIAVRGELAEAGVTTMGDIGGWIADGNDFRLAASEEFVSRPDVLPAFEEAYDFKLSQEHLLVFSGGNTATTMQAAARNQDGVNAAMAYGTDGQLAALGLQVLDDTEGVQPVYQPAPVIREEVIAAYPEIETLLRPVFAGLDREILQQLNASIAVEGRSAEVVAETYLQEQGLID